MKVAVISDTHGHTGRVMAYIEHEKDKIDEIWHLGDYYNDFALYTGIPVVAVRGNGDIGVKGPESLVIERMGHKVFLTHGHHYRVKQSLMQLFYKGIEESFDLICFGHTHKPTNLLEEGVRLFNPGSPTHPYPSCAPTIGIIEFSDNGISTKHIHL